MKADPGNCRRSARIANLPTTTTCTCNKTCNYRTSSKICNCRSSSSRACLHTPRTPNLPNTVTYTSTHIAPTPTPHQHTHHTHTQTLWSRGLRTQSRCTYTRRICMCSGFRRSLATGATPFPSWRAHTPVDPSVRTHIRDTNTFSLTHAHVCLPTSLSPVIPEIEHTATLKSKMMIAGDSANTHM